MHHAWHMRRRCAGLRTLLLLVICLTVAAHPLARSLAAIHASPPAPAIELQVVICTSHGPLVIDAPAEYPQPVKDSPSCLWCAVAGGSALKLPAFTTTLFGEDLPPLLASHRLPETQSKVALTPLDWPPGAPRGPPCSMAA